MAGGWARTGGRWEVDLQKRWEKGEVHATPLIIGTSTKCAASVVPRARKSVHDFTPLRLPESR